MTWPKLLTAIKWFVVALFSVMAIGLFLLPAPAISHWFWMASFACSIAVLAIIYVVFAIRTRVKPAWEELNYVQPNIDSLTPLIEANAQKLRASHAWVFYQLMLDPQKIIKRITEDVHPFTRSVAVNTSMLISLPEDMENGEILLPVVVVPHAGLSHGLVLRDENSARIPTVSSRDFLAYAGAIIRVLMCASLKEPGHYSAVLESAVITSISHGNRTEFEATSSISDSLIEKLRALPYTGQPDESLVLRNAAVDLIRLLSAQTVVCVERRLFKEQGTIAPSESFVITSEQRLIPAPVSRKILKRKDKKYNGELLLPVRVQANGYPEGKFFKTVTRRSRTHGTRVRYQAPARPALSFEWARRLLGVRKTQFFHPLAGADRAASYHLEFLGPEGTYLAKQAMYGYMRRTETQVPTNTLPISFQPRMGQRGAHLYVRNGQGFKRRFVSFHFFERMPGSVGAAAATAFAQVVILAIAVLSNFHGLGKPASEGGADIIAILFAFPPIAAAWVGIDSAGTLRGGVLLARGVLVSTVLLSCIACALYLCGATDVQAPAFLIVPKWDFSIRMQWGLVIAASLMNFCIASIAWFNRTVAQAHFSSDPYSKATKRVRATSEGVSS